MKLGSDMKRNLIVLVGPKGAGKTHIGSLLERQADVRFVRVEPLFLRAQAEHRDAVPDVVDAVRLAGENSTHVCIETTGASQELLNRYLELLGADFDILPVRVHARDDLYLRRVRQRDQTDHIPVSDELVLEVNRLAAAVTLEWAATIDTTDDPSDDDVLLALQHLSPSR